MRSVVLVLALLTITFLMTDSALARSQKSSKAHKRTEPVATEPKPPLDEGGSAVASCKKHVESMLKESAETRFSCDGEMRIQHPDGNAYDVAGWVTSKTVAGDLRRADFNCHASRYGGGLWTTKTSLSFDR